MHAGGGLDAFLEEHAVIVIADHSHRGSSSASRWPTPCTGDGLRVLRPSDARPDEAEVALCPGSRVGDGLRARRERRERARARAWSEAALDDRRASTW